MTHYSATSLEQIADELERLSDLHVGKARTAIGNAWQNQAGKYKTYNHQLGQAVAYAEAATLVRNTRLADPAMEAMVKALERLCREADELDRLGLGDALDQAEAALKLAKDNGHV